MSKTCVSLITLACVFLPLAVQAQSQGADEAQSSKFIQTRDRDQIYSIKS